MNSANDNTASPSLPPLPPLPPATARSRKTARNSAEGGAWSSGVDDPIYKAAQMTTVRRMLKRIFAIGAGIGAGALFSIGALQLGAWWNLWPDRDLERNTAQVREVMRLIHNRYVDADAVPYDQLQKAALDGLAGSLDPHSGFLPAKEYRLLQEEIGSEFGGIGVQVEMVDGRLVIIAPIRGTPGDRAGLIRGD